MVKGGNQTSGIRRWIQRGSCLIEGAGCSLNGLRRDATATLDAGSAKAMSLGMKVGRLGG